MYSHKYIGKNPLGRHVAQRVVLFRPFCAEATCGWTLFQIVVKCMRFNMCMCVLAITDDRLIYIKTDVCEIFIECSMRWVVGVERLP